MPYNLVQQNNCTETATTAKRKETMDAFKENVFKITTYSEDKKLAHHRLAAMPTATLSVS